MRALVAGSSGLIGSALVARLRAEGHEVHRIVRGEPADGEARIDLAARSLDASRLPGGSLEGFDAVFNLAGEPLTPRHWYEPPRWSPAKRQRIRSSRVDTTDVIASALGALDRPPQVLVNASAVGYYGDRGDELLVEGSRPGGDFLADVCVEWEAAAEAAEQAGVRVVRVRSGVVLDRGGGLLAFLLPLFERGLGARLGGGWQWTSWITLDDEVSALLHAATTPSLAGPLNAVAPAPCRNRELTAALAECVGRPALLSVPAGPLRMALGRDASGFVLASARVLPRKLQNSGFSFAHPELDEAVRAALGSAQAGGHGHSRPEAPSGGAAAAQHPPRS